MKASVSVVIPLYNKELTIQKTIKSVLDRACDDVEVIVVDDGSIDSSADLVEAMGDDRVHLIRKNNGGPSSARNVGIISATKDWIVFLDADDELTSGALNIFKQIIEDNPGYDVYAGNFFLYDGVTRSLYSDSYHDGSLSNPYRSWFFKRFMPCAGTCAYRRSLLVNNLYDETLRRYEDAEMVLRLLLNARVYRFSTPVMCYHREMSSASYRRKDISEDFLGHLSLNHKSIWHKLIEYDFYIQAKNLYGTESAGLYGTFAHRYDLMVLYRVMCEIRFRLK